METSSGDLSQLHARSPSTTIDWELGFWGHLPQVLPKQARLTPALACTTEPQFIACQPWLACALRGYCLLDWLWQTSSGSCNPTNISAHAASTPSPVRSKTQPWEWEASLLKCSLSGMLPPSDLV